MWQQFTAAAERVLHYASGWRNRTECSELEMEPLLVGLLSEPECRAGIFLSDLGITTSEVRRQWPNLAEDNPLQGGATQKPFSRQVELSLQLARDRLSALPQPIELATEHILLGLALSDGAVGAWLRGRGLDPNALAAKILAIHGCSSQEDVGEEGGGPIFVSTKTERSPSTLPARSDISTLRIMDAAANRAREGLRVVEDYVRFVLDDSHLTGLCKQLRHDLTETLSHLSMEHRLAARETQADVGTKLSTLSEQTRTDATEVLAANFARLQESLRSLEEYGKLWAADMAYEFEQLRYRTYTLQRAVDATRNGLQRLADAKLYVLIDGRSNVEEFERLARQLIGAGVDILQLRDKQLGDRSLLERARLLRELTRGTATLFVMNDRPDLARLAGADGVHVGQEELGVKDVRSLVGPEMLIGVSTHGIEQARQAVLDGANYIGVGPTFPSSSKRFERFPGLEFVRTVAAEIRLPAFAIGGIDRRNVGEVLTAGMSRIAVSGAVLSAEDPAEAARELIQLLHKSNSDIGSDNP